MMDLKLQIMRVNQLSNDIDVVYHSVAQHFDLSDNIYWIFYILHDSSERLTQTDLSRKWLFSKKTVNSSITAMVKKGWITLELLPDSRKAKAIRLTETGKGLGKKVVDLTQKLEQQAYSQFSEAELDQLLRLLERVNKRLQSAANDLLVAD